MIMAAAGATQQYRYRWPRREVPPRTRKKMRYCTAVRTPGTEVGHQSKIKQEPNRKREPSSSEKFILESQQLFHFDVTIKNFRLVFTWQNGNNVSRWFERIAHIGSRHSPMHGCHIGACGYYRGSNGTTNWNDWRLNKKPQTCFSVIDINWHTYTIIFGKFVSPNVKGWSRCGNLSFVFNFRPFISSLKCATFLGDNS